MFTVHFIVQLCSNYQSAHVLIKNLPQHIRELLQKTSTLSKKYFRTLDAVTVDRARGPIVFSPFLSREKFNNKALF